MLAMRTSVSAVAWDPVLPALARGRSTNNMVEWIAKLEAAESRRSHATPSTPPFHEAARETETIAAEIWETARQSDEDTPQTAANQLTARRPPTPVVA